MTYQTYAEYLKTPQFAATVALVRSRSKGICEDCKSQSGVDPHHVRYCKWGEYDPPENLVLLCRRCHEKRHTCTKCGFVAIKAKHVKSGSTICDQCKLNTWKLLKLGSLTQSAKQTTCLRLNNSCVHFVAS